MVFHGVLRIKGRTLASRWLRRRVSSPKPGQSCQTAGRVRSRALEALRDGRTWSTARDHLRPGPVYLIIDKRVFQRRPPMCSTPTNPIITQMLHGLPSHTDVTAPQAAGILAVSRLHHPRAVFVALLSRRKRLGIVLPANACTLKIVGSRTVGCLQVGNLRLRFAPKIRERPDYLVQDALLYDHMCSIHVFPAYSRLRTAMEPA